VLNNKVLVGIAALLVVAIAIFFVLYNHILRTDQGKTRPILIGAVLPLTGPAASIGKAAANGLQLCMEEFNSQGGIQGRQIELLIEDGGGDPKTSISAYRKLIDVHGVKFIITTLSSVSMSLSPLAEREKIILFADAAHPDITKGRAYVFRHSNVADQEASAILSHLALINAHARVATLVVHDDYGNAIASSVQHQIVNSRDGLILVAAETYPNTETDFRSHIARLTAANPDCIVIGGLSTSMGLAIRRLREQGFVGTIYVTLPFVLLPDGIAAAGSAIHGVYYNTFAFQESALIAKLEQEYTKRFHEKMPVSAVIEYNTMQLLLYAIEQVSYDTARVDSFLRSLKTFNAVGESIILNADGDAASPIVVNQFE